MALALEWIARAGAKLVFGFGTETNRGKVVVANPVVPGPALAENQQVFRF
jgi:hypothetical protein